MADGWLSSPMCPWCGDEIAVEIEILYAPDQIWLETTCAGCDQPVRVERLVVTEYRAEKGEASK